VKRVRVALAIDQAFELFTAGMGEWWPLEVHSIAQDTHEGRVKAQSLIFEARPGGHIRELMSDGSEGVWGTVLEWEPPTRVVFSWKPNLEDAPFTEIEVRFTSAGAETDVELKHRGWERFGRAAAERRNSYDAGWPRLLELYRSAAARR
jgi:uncharacterized protein YndB with AHSA1/START domain